MRKASTSRIRPGRAADALTRLPATAWRALPSLRRFFLVVLASVLVFGGLPGTAEAKKPRWVTHKVKRGDTLSRIAKRYRTTAAKIRKLNGLTRRTAILPGQRLRVRLRQGAKAEPETRKKRSASKRDPAPRSKRHRSKTNPKQRAKSRHDHKHSKKKGRSTEGWITHKVKRGDYLWGLADKYDVTIKELVRNNRLGKRPRLRPGMVLRIKEGRRQKLIGGVVLPRSGPGYKAVRPKRSWGTPGTVRLIQEVYEEVAERHPGTVPGVVADLSQEGGGHLPPHRSHQRGVDVDVSYFKVGNKKTRGLEVMTEETFDLEKNWSLIRAFINTGNVSVIFMDHKLQALLHAHLKARGYDDELLGKIMQYPRSKSERRGILRHHPGHHHHLHVRFTCDSPTDPCTRPAVAMVPDYPNQPRVMVAAVDRRAVPAPDQRHDDGVVGEPVAVGRQRDSLVREAGAGNAPAERSRRVAAVNPAPGRDAFAEIAGIRGPQPGLDAYARLDTEAPPAAIPVAGGVATPSPAPVLPRRAESSERMARFGCAP